MARIVTFAVNQLGANNPGSAQARVIKHVALLLSLCYLIFSPPATFSQNVQHTQNTVDQASKSSLRVDPSTLGLNITIPLRSYPGRAGLDVPVSLTFSSKDLWRMEYSGYYQGGTCCEPSFQAYPQGLPDDNNYSYVGVINGEGGWRGGFERPYIISGGREIYNFEGYPCDACPLERRNYVHRFRIRTPDGSTHEFRKSDAVYSHGREPSQSGTYYAVDSSRMRYVHQAVTGGTHYGTLYMPDGSRFLMGDQTNKYIDRNGNTLTYDSTVTGWRDTLGRSVGLVRSNNPVSPTDDQIYTLRGFGGVNQKYTFRYRYLENARTDPANNPLCTTGDMFVTGQMPPQGPSLFHSAGGTRVTPVNLYNPTVLYEIELPDGSKYTFTYNSYGEIDKVVLPTGGYERYRFDTIPGIDPVNEPYAQTNRGVVERWVSEKGMGSDEKRWRYSVDSSSTYTVTITNPDGSYTERRLLRGRGPETLKFGFDDARAGMAYDERVYSPRGQMLRRKLTAWAQSGTQVGGVPSSTATRDPRVTKEVEILLEDSGQALTKTTTYEYDADLNIVSTNEFDFYAVAQSVAQDGRIDTIPAGTLLRSVVTTYLVNDASIPADTRDSYRAQNLISLPTSTITKDGSGTVVAQSELRYDETVDPLLSCPSIIEWTDPDTKSRGNVTTARRWLDTQKVWIETHTQYDQAGNVRKTWDAMPEGQRGNVSEVEYSSAYQYAYPTTTISPVPDTTGVNGSETAFETTSAYDFSTGLVTSTTDVNRQTTPYVNRQTTSYSYTAPDGTIDPLSRLRKVTRPDGGWTSYEFGNTPGSFYVRTRTAIDASRSTDVYQYLDGLGRATRAYSFNGDAQLPWVATETRYDVMGRASEVSNPIRVKAQGDDVEASEWTTSEYDALGRIITVTTPDEAKIITAYQGTKMMVTDQGSKSRRSETDALGRLANVVEYTRSVPDPRKVEAPNAADYQTSYIYDVLGNLRTVTQGEQTRTFVYDSLSRLRSAVNPESGTVNYDYDTNGNLKRRVDARGVVTDYTYDALNRIKTRSHSDDTPTVTYLYDGVGMNATPTSNFAGQLTSVKSAVSETHYNQFDALGRVKQSTQVTDGRAYSMSYEYNLAGSTTSQTYPSGRVVHTNYDPAGRISEVYRGQGAETRFYASSFTYTAHGAVSDMRLGGASVDRPDTGQFCVTGPCKGLWEHWDYNSRLQPKRIAVGGAQDHNDASRLEINYTYGEVADGVLDEKKNNGNVESQTINVLAVNGVAGFNAKQSYEYDKLNRLATAQEASNGQQVWKQVYKYDRFGNRTFNSGTTLPALPASLADKINNPTISASTNRINEQQDGDGVKDYEYDAAGNVTKNAEGRTFAYDAENRQVSLDKDPNTAEKDATYSYDGDGRRVKKVVSGVATTFVYDAEGRLVAEYTNSPQTQTGGTRFVIADMLGSTRLVADELGDVKGRHDYQPFGEELFVGRTQPGYGVMDIRQKFTGYERDDESKLDFAQARYYGSTQGRFTSVDPLMASANPGNPKTWNRYVYTLNNPLRLIDPSGLVAQDPQKWVWATDGQKNYRRFTQEEWDAYENDPNLDFEWAPVPAGTNIGELRNVHGPPSFVERNKGLEGWAVTLGADGNFHTASCLNCGGLVSELGGKRGPAVQAAIEAMFHVSMAVTGGFTTLGSTGAASLVGLRSTPGMMIQGSKPGTVVLGKLDVVKNYKFGSDESALLLDAVYQGRAGLKYNLMAVEEAYKMGHSIRILRGPETGVFFKELQTLRQMGVRIP